MKELFLIIIFFHFGFISNIDIDFQGETGIYNLTSGETYKFFVPVEQMVRIYIDFKFVNFTYAPFNQMHIREYSSRNGTSLRSYIIRNIKYHKSEDFYFYYVYFNLKNFSSTYISFSFKSNSTIDNVIIALSFYGGLYNLSNGVIKEFEEISSSTPYYFAIPTTCYSKIKIELNSSDYYFDYLVLNIIEYQKNNSNYYIYKNQKYEDYTIETIDHDIMTISFNYLIKNKNTNFFAIKIYSSNYYISYLNISLSEDRYYYDLYDENSLDIFDLKQNQTYHFSLRAKIKQLFVINYSIFVQDLNETRLPLESIIIYEDESEFASDHLLKFFHHQKIISESFSYAVSQLDTKYLTLEITPKIQIEKFNISYNMKNEIKTLYKLENNVLLTLPELYPYFTYEFNINSKILELLEYEIIIKNGNISFPPFEDISLIENPLIISHKDKLSFKKDGNYLRANSSFKITHYNTKFTTISIKSYEYIGLFSIKVKVIGDNFYYLTEEAKKTISLLKKNFIII